MRQEQRWIWAILHLHSKRAAEELVRKYYDEIYAFVYRQLRDREDAKDVTQECFLSMLQSLQGYDAGKAGFRTWLYRVAAHKVIDFQRSAARQSGIVPLREESETEYRWEIRGGKEDFAWKDTGRDFTFGVENRLLLEQVDDFVGREPSEVQEVFRLRLYGELSFPEISRQLQEPEEKIKARYYRLLGRLRKEFGGDGEE